MKNYLVLYKDEFGNGIEIPVFAENKEIALAKANVRLYDVTHNNGILVTSKYRFIDFI